MDFNTKNSRSKKLKAIARSIIKFSEEMTHEDDATARKHLFDAIEKLSQAANELVRLDNEISFPDEPSREREKTD